MIDHLENYAKQGKEILRISNIIKEVGKLCWNCYSWKYDHDVWLHRCYITKEITEQEFTCSKWNNKLYRA